jgi:hypothetical protein
MKKFKLKLDLVKRKLRYSKEVPLYSPPSKFIRPDPVPFFSGPTLPGRSGRNEKVL